MKKEKIIFLVVLAIVGLIDAAYLTREHYLEVIPPCSTSLLFLDCGKVLESSYSMIFGIPLALIGLIHYSFETIALIFVLIKNNRASKYLAVFLTAVGFMSSLYFIYLQLIVIGAICVFCMLSALVSISLFLLVQHYFKTERKHLIIKITSILYTRILKPILFLVNPEVVHEHMTRTGSLMGNLIFPGKLFSYLFNSQPVEVSQKVLGIKFASPIGLAAGFDYHAQLTQILPDLGFGFETIGTITNLFYEGNAKPRLGRLPKSRSLMVNKGFKNLGASETIKKLEGLKFKFPLGISIGKTNSEDINTTDSSIDDIIQCFKKFMASKVSNAYYELNISCPNLKGNVSFYPSKNLHKLLTAIDKLKLDKPLLIKMPIDKTNQEVKSMLTTIVKHKVQGVIFGNLQKNRQHPSLDTNEVARFPIGYFSGKPCFERSNELISLAYKTVGKKLLIVGCGGVFSAEDAFEKITRGATLIQLITGMIYQGPQLISQINIELAELLRQKGYKHISEAIGTKS